MFSTIAQRVFDDVAATRKRVLRGEAVSADTLADLETALAVVVVYTDDAGEILQAKLQGDLLAEALNTVAVAKRDAARRAEDDAYFASLPF